MFASKAGNGGGNRCFVSLVVLTAQSRQIPTLQKYLYILDVKVSVLV